MAPSATRDLLGQESLGWQDDICLLTTIEATTHSGTKTVFLATPGTAGAGCTSEEASLRTNISLRLYFPHAVTMVGE